MSPLRPLTALGRALLASGVTAALSGLVMSERDLVRVGVIVAVAPLLAALYVVRRRVTVEVRRDVTPVQVVGGGRARVRVTVGARRRLPATEAIDRLPYVLGDSARVRLPALAPGTITDFDYPLRPEMRGRFLIGPLRMRLSDPFGLAEHINELPETTEIVVTPRVARLTPLPGLRSAEGGEGTHTESGQARGNVSDALVREYRSGDDLRRVHWRSTARTGDLMVRREEHPHQSVATVLIDNRGGRHHGRGPTASIERAVSAAASVAVHLAERGYDVRLLTPDAEPVTNQSHQLRILALLPLVGGDPSGPQARHLADLVAGPLVLVAAEVRRTDEWLTQLARRTPTAVAVLVGEDEASADELRRTGWRVTTWPSGTRLEPGLDAAWRRLAR